MYKVNYYNYEDLADEFFAKYHNYGWVENEKDYTYTLSVPGLDNRDVKVFINSDTIKFVLEEDGEYTNKFNYEFSISELRTDKDKAVKTVENGVLKLVLPKRELETVEL